MTVIFAVKNHQTTLDEMLLKNGLKRIGGRLTRLLLLPTLPTALVMNGIQFW